MAAATTTKVGSMLQNGKTFFGGPSESVAPSKLTSFGRSGIDAKKILRSGINAKKLLVRMINAKKLLE
jgi:hypothetical protein